MSFRWYMKQNLSHADILNINISETIWSIWLKFAPCTTNKQRLMRLNMYVILFRFVVVRVICLLVRYFFWDIVYLNATIGRLFRIWLLQFLDYVTRVFECMVFAIHRVSKKLCQLIFCSLTVKYEPISLKIVRIVPEETPNKTVPEMSTSPKVRACATLGNLKYQIELLTQ